MHNVRSKLRSVLFISAISCAMPVMSQVRVLDTFDSLSGWRAVTSHGSASSLRLALADGSSGAGMLMEFSFLGYMGSAAAEKRFAVPLPPDYQISFDVRGEGPVNNFVVRLMDSLDNVWWVNRTNFTLPKKWAKMTIRKHQIQYGWGPSGGRDLRVLDRIMLMIDVVDGGKGKIWIDNLAIESIGGVGAARTKVTASSSQRGSPPRVSHDGTTISGWHSAAGSDSASITVESGDRTVRGGLVIDWDGRDFARSFNVLLSEDGKSWTTAYAAPHCGGGRSYVCLNDAEGKFLKIVMLNSRSGKGYGIKRLALKGPEFGFSITDFFGAVSAGAPRGIFPRYIYKEQSYWTVVGVPADTKEALVNEDGMVETDKLSFSLMPFLSTGGRLITWNDVEASQSLDKGYLPIPTVRWVYRKTLKLTETVFAAGKAGESVLFVRYLVENTGPPTEGQLFIGICPFQVNPPWQTFTVIGGPAPIDSIAYDGRVRVNDRVIFPMTPPNAFGASEFDEGYVTEYLRTGLVPPSHAARDHFRYASAALQYDFSLGRGETKAVVLAIPFHGEHEGLITGATSSPDPAVEFERLRGETARLWDTKLSTVSITLPPSAPPIANAIRSNLAYILINADGAALQPGSRSYERSWIRDGALTATAMVQMGITDEVRSFIEWYGGYQYPNGKIPAVVESRGPEPTPENDSHGQFIYMIRQYFDFTHDTTWLRAQWPRVVKTVDYIRALCAQRKTDEYRNGTPLQQACYGLMPESISHEGYTPAPMHSYWDDFFTLRGLKDAAYMAQAVGDASRTALFALERDDFKNDLYGSMQRAIHLKNIKYIPGCVELGDFSGLSTTIAITPCGEMENMPQKEMHYTFDESYRLFRQRKENTVPWDSYLPYEARFIGAYVLLGEKERAAEILDYLMHDRRPAAWNGWGEVVWKDLRAPKSIGDMPHSWAGSDFIRSVRAMFVFELEKDDALVISAGIPDAWVQDGDSLALGNLPTAFGRLDYSIARHGTTILVNVSGTAAIPAGKIVVMSPLSRRPRNIRIDGNPAPVWREVKIERLPARVEFNY